MPLTNWTSPPASTIARTRRGLSRSGLSTATVIVLPSTVTPASGAAVVAVLAVVAASRAAATIASVTTASWTVVACREAAPRSPSGVPTATSLVCMMPTRSHIRSASASWWVLSRMVRCSRLSWRRKSRTVLAPSGSRFAVGSSRKSTAGSWISARAMVSRCFMPLENVRTRASRRSHRPSMVSSRSVRSARAAAGTW